MPSVFRPKPFQQNLCSHQILISATATPGQACVVLPPQLHMHTRQFSVARTRPVRLRALAICETADGGSVGDVGVPPCNLCLTRHGSHTRFDRLLIRRGGCLVETDDNAGLMATRGRGRFEVVVCVCAGGRARGLSQKKNEAVRLCVVCERHEHLL